MMFRIQSSMPRNTGDYDSEDEKLSEAIETIFPMMTEDAFIVWRTLFISLNYRYDVSYMIEDILNMLKRFRKSDIGEIDINWVSNSFSCNWKLVWDNKMLNIKSEWNNVNGHIENLLNDLNEINIEKVLFISEWKKLLEILIKNLEQCGYNKKNIIEMERLIEEYEYIKQYGVLYK